MDNDLGLFDDVQHRKQGAAAGRRQAATASQSSDLQSSATALHDPGDHHAHTTAVADGGHTQDLKGFFQQGESLGLTISSPEAAVHRSSLDAEHCHIRDSSAPVVAPIQPRGNGPRSSVPKSMKDLDGEIFGDDDLSTNAQQQAQNMGMSRRKQHLMAAQEQKTRDKYAEEKEIDVGELQTLDEPAQDDISKQEQLVEKNDVWDEDLLLTEVVSELELGKENEKWGG